LIGPGTKPVYPATAPWIAECASSVQYRLSAALAATARTMYVGSMYFNVSGSPACSSAYHAPSSALSHAPTSRNTGLPDSSCCCWLLLWVVSRNEVLPGALGDDDHGVAFLEAVRSNSPPTPRR
jgi:hypothetical protein